MPITIIAGRESFFHDICFFYRASLGGPDERREQKFATLVGDHFGMSPTNILLTLIKHIPTNKCYTYLFSHIADPIHSFWMVKAFS
ncbi:hypothetical protein B9L21_12305 [Geobacillus uzenensis]|uniref:Uncharacterized protein n=1 Tax=Geobacillus uzenensis TaxID=129339 RepID=A0ABX4DFJ5_9BACL|nr:hypothetical protein B9L21_12305 [Geobacillus uzenensis]